MHSQYGACLVLLACLAFTMAAQVDTSTALSKAGMGIARAHRQLSTIRSKVHLEKAYNSTMSNSMGKVLLKTLAEKYRVKYSVSPTTECDMLRLLRLIRQTEDKIEEEQKEFKATWLSHDAALSQEIKEYDMTAQSLLQRNGPVLSELDRNRKLIREIQPQRDSVELEIAHVSKRVDDVLTNKTIIVNKLGTDSALYVAAVAELEYLIKSLEHARDTLRRSTSARGLVQEVSSHLEISSEMAHSQTVRQLIESTQLSVFAAKKSKNVPHRLETALGKLSDSLSKHLAAYQTNALVGPDGLPRQLTGTEAEALAVEMEVQGLGYTVQRLKRQLRYLAERQHHLRMTSTLLNAELEARAARGHAALIDKTMLMTRRANYRHAFERETSLRKHQLVILGEIDTMLKHHGPDACKKIVERDVPPPAGLSYVNKNAVAQTVYFPKKYREAPCVFLEGNDMQFIPHRYKLTEVTDSYFTVTVQRMTGWTHQTLSLTWHAVGDLA